MKKTKWEYVYGVNPAFEVVRGGKREILAAMLSESSQNHPRMKKLAKFFESKGVEYEWVSKGRIFDFAQSKEHQGVVLRTSLYPYVPYSEVLGRDRLLLLDNVEDPHNTGAIIRCADCFGFKSVLLPVRGTPEVYASVVKVSAGATEHLDICREASANSYMNDAVKNGYKVIALDAKGETEIRELKPIQEKILLVIGGEAKSVGQYILNKADHRVRIDMTGRINSLNASVASGIAMYALSGQTNPSTLT